MKTNLKNRTPFILPLYFFSSLFLLCSQTSINQARNSTQTGNGMIVGVIFNKDGSFAKNANVSLRKRSSLADTSGTMLKKIVAIDTATTITNDSGKFVIDSIDTGTYVILSTDGTNNIALNDSVYVRCKDSMIIVPNDTLKPAGAIKGIIKLAERGDVRKVFVLAFGVDRFAKVNTDGSFKMSALAEGKYSLRFISSLDNYGVLDLENISVQSSDTTNLDTINLPFTGIPTPKGIKVSYDTLKQIVSLAWNKLDSSIVHSFNIYKRNIDSNTVLQRLNSNPIVDTIFLDSNGSQDQTYEYMIAAVDKNATEGTKRLAGQIKLIGAFKVQDTLASTSGTVGTFAFDSKGSIYLTNTTTKEIEVYNSSGQKIRSWSRPGRSDFSRVNGMPPDNLYIDKSDKIYLYTYYDSIIIYDTSGTFIRAITGTIGSCEGMYVINDSLFISAEQPDRKILIFDLHDSKGTQIGTINNNWSMENFYSLIGDSLDLYLFGGFSSHLIEIINKNGVFKKAIWAGKQFHEGILTKNANSFLFTSKSYILNLDQDGNLLFKFSVQSGAIKAIDAGNSSLIIGFRDGHIMRYVRR